MMDRLHSPDFKKLPGIGVLPKRDVFTQVLRTYDTGYYLPSEMKSSHPFVNMQALLEQIVIMNLPLHRIAKRTSDIILSSLVIIFLLPWTMFLVAIFIKCDSRGPVLFMQKRKGFHGRSFTCVKFRTMYVNVESDTEPAGKNDPRITPFGKLLRKYHIDELPQFLNVLGGSMAIVGPRPHMISENNYYEEVIENYAFRYKVKPGITGLGQVNNRINISNREKMGYRIFWDILYIKNWSQYLDIWIIFKTFFVCLKGNKPL